MYAFSGLNRSVKIGIDTVCTDGYWYVSNSFSLLTQASLSGSRPCGLMSVLKSSVIAPQVKDPDISLITVSAVGGVGDIVRKQNKNKPG